MAPKIVEISAPPANHSDPRYMSQCYVVTAARCAPVPRDVDVDVNVDEDVDEEMSLAKNRADEQAKWTFKCCHLLRENATGSQKTFSIAISWAAEGFGIATFPGIASDLGLWAPLSY